MPAACWGASLTRIQWSRLGGGAHCHFQFFYSYFVGPLKAGACRTASASRGTYSVSCALAAKTKYLKYTLAAGETARAGQTLVSGAACRPRARILWKQKLGLGSKQLLSRSLHSASEKSPGTLKHMVGFTGAGSGRPLPQGELQVIFWLLFGMSTTSRRLDCGENA